MFARIIQTLFHRPAAADWQAQALAHSKAGAHARAEALCRAALAAKPRNMDAVKFLAAAVLAQGRQAEGIELLRGATALAPDDDAAHMMLGQVLATVGDFEAALISFKQAAHLSPGTTAAWIALAHLLKALGRYDEAETCCNAGLQSAPQDTALSSTRYAVLFEQGRVDEALAQARAVLSLTPENAAVHSDVLRMLNYADLQDPTAVWHAHQQWGLRHGDTVARLPSPAARAEPQRRLRVGFVSPYFRKHAVTFFLEPVIEHHDAAAQEIFLYADVVRPDEYSQRLQAYGAIWRRTVNLDDAQLAAQVRDDEIDLLVDLSGHTPGNRLLAFARRPARIQATWNGYPNTTGLRAIDYRITDRYCDPPGRTEHLHSEMLLRMPDVFMRWRLPDDAPPVAPLPALANGFITFGSFNACFKITPSLVALWSRLLKGVNNSRLKIFTLDGDTARRRVLALFAAQGIESGRLELCGRLGHTEFLAAHDTVDIALDAFPYHGTTTTCFSLWMGTPVVTLAGAVHASRVGVSLLNCAGLPELVAHSPDEYCAIAAGLAADTAALAQRRAAMREHLRRQPLTDGVAGARDFERAVRHMWIDYCNKTGARTS